MLPISHRGDRWSIFFADVERRLVAGVLATSYGATYVALLERDSGHSLLDLVAFVCFALIGVVGVMNVVRTLPAVRTRIYVIQLLAASLCAASWIYTSLAAPAGIGGGEAVFYGLAAVGALAAWIDANRGKASSRWSLLGPLGLFAVWSIAQAFSANLAHRYVAIVASIASIALILLLQRHTHLS